MYENDLNPKGLEPTEKASTAKAVGFLYGTYQTSKLVVRCARKGMSVMRKPKWLSNREWYKATG